MMNNSSASTRKPLTIAALKREAKRFAKMESSYPEPVLYGITDGKAIGTYLEHKFKAHLAALYDFIGGNSATGIDLPSIEVDIKVTSVTQPQSSCPFKTGRQKIFGLGYSLLLFVYSKADDPKSRTGTLDIRHTVFIDKHLTADNQVTMALNRMLANDANEEDLIGYMNDKMLPLSDIEAGQIASELIATGGSVPVGYLTISNALQWRLQYFTGRPRSRTYKDRMSANTQQSDSVDKSSLGISRRLPRLLVKSWHCWLSPVLPPRP